MKTLNRWQEELWAAGKTVSEVSKKEIIEGLDIIAQAMMEGKATLAHANALLAIRYGLQSEKDRATEYANLSDFAVALGRKGGQAKSEKKAASCRENGKKGGRPRKVK